MSEKTVIERELAGKRLVMETGELAKQAGGSVLVRYGDSVVIANATRGSKPREGIDFFPLTVDYEEKLYAAGKIPGGFIKREGRPSEKSILTSRLIDRPIRPLFPEGMRNEVQVVVLVLSADQVNDTDIPAMLGASAALAISDIPFLGPIGAVRIGYLDGEYLVNPTYDERSRSDLDLVVAGTKDSIAMVEAGALEVSEEVVLGALAKAQEVINEMVAFIKDLAEKAGKPKAEIPLFLPDRDLEAIVRKHFTGEIRTSMRILDKQEREAALDRVSKEAMVEIIEKHTHTERDRLLAIMLDEKAHDFEMIVKKIEEEELRIMIVEENLRPDGRAFNQIRPLSCTVGLLPRTHGSGLFTRGQTQVLNILTLGMKSEEQMLDGLGGEESKRYMHQYNFPPFSVGECRPMRGPGRREIGHGALAERSLVRMIPPEDEFPYTLRLVSEVLESNGSTSMASVCASTLSLMDAGVPIKAPVAGIAMGLVVKGDRFQVLTDIQGMEDALGEMDFKVAGTSKGITALQMDIKLTGISMDVMRTALAQAKEARLHILDVMRETIAEPRPDLSPYAPRIIVMQIHPDKIKDVIGPGGKIINKIIAETGVKIDIENDGRIFIGAVDMEAGNKAQAIINDLTRDVEVGEVYSGKVVRLMNFGAFVEILPGKEGLVHISELAHGRVDRVEDVVNVGDELVVKVMEIDSQGRINLTNAAKKEAPPSTRPYAERRSGGERRPGGGRPGGDRGPRRDSGRPRERESSRPRW
jgi:polyribonucleotide nucleotidyltransferase